MGNMNVKEFILLVTDRGINTRMRLHNAKVVFTVIDPITSSLV